MFDNFNTFKNRKNSDELRTKSAPEIACIIYHFSIKESLEQIQNDKINGSQFIKMYQNKDKFIEISLDGTRGKYIKLKLFYSETQYDTKEITQNMNEIMNKKKQSLIL